jgi:hypothetical protein
MSRSSAYAAVRKGSFPVEILRIGSRQRVRSADVLRVLGIDAN